MLKQGFEDKLFPWEAGSKLGKEYVKAVYCHPAYLTYVQSAPWETLGWMKHKLESRLLGEIAITSDTQMTPPLWRIIQDLVFFQFYSVVLGFLKAYVTVVFLQGRLVLHSAGYLKASLTGTTFKWYSTLEVFLTTQIAWMQDQTFVGLGSGYWF